MDHRLQFVAAVLRAGGPDEHFTNLCRRFGVSRKTGYKWSSASARGAAALVDQSRRPRHSPHATDAASVAALLTLRGRVPLEMQLRDARQHDPTCARPGKRKDRPIAGRSFSLPTPRELTSDSPGSPESASPRN